MLDRPTVAAAIAAPVLIHPKGALDHDAIAREVERRTEVIRAELIAKGYKGEWLEALVKRNRETQEIWVNAEAIKQRNPFVHIAYRWSQTEADLAELARLEEAAESCPISMRGNRDYEKILAAMDEIRSRGWLRALDCVEGSA